MARGRDNSRSRSGRPPRSVFDSPREPGRRTKKHFGYGEKPSAGEKYASRAEEPPYGPEWAFTCKLVKKRDNYTCTNPRCRVRHAPPNHGKLDVHHIIRRERGGPDTPDNLRTLCKPCHSLEHPHLRKIGYGQPKRKKY